MGIFCTTEPFDLAGTAMGPGVLTMVVGARFVGVDEPKATEVVFTWTTRLIRAELDRAETINELIRRSRLSFWHPTWSDSKEGLDPFECRWFWRDICILGGFRCVYDDRLNNNSGNRSSIQWSIALNRRIDRRVRFLFHGWLGLFLFRSTTCRWCFRIIWGYLSGSWNRNRNTSNRTRRWTWSSTTLGFLHLAFGWNLESSVDIADQNELFRLLLRHPYGVSLESAVFREWIGSVHRTWRWLAARKSWDFAAFQSFRAAVHRISLVNCLNRVCFLWSHIASSGIPSAHVGVCLRKVVLSSLRLVSGTVPCPDRVSSVALPPEDVTHALRIAERARQSDWRRWEKEFEDDEPIVCRSVMCRSVDVDWSVLGGFVLFHG